MFSTVFCYHNDKFILYWYKKALNYIDVLLTQIPGDIYSKKDLACHFGSYTQSKLRGTRHKGRTSAVKSPHHYIEFVGIYRVHCLPVQCTFNHYPMLN